MTRSRFAVAIAVVCVACVKVPDTIKGTFSEHQNGEVDNFAPRAPHTFAPSDPILTQAVIVLDASTNDATAPMTMGICTREENASSTLDAGAPLSGQAELRAGAQNCSMQDAGNP